MSSSHTQQPNPHDPSRGGTRAPGARPPAAPAAALPRELTNHPRYQVLRELGRGGMGVVYQARQTVMNRPVVIKVINKALLDQPDALERFHREVTAAARLSHPNIVVAYDAEQAGDLHMLVMEFVPGQSLAEVLEKKGPLPVADACRYVRQAALGLQHAHEQKMVHRDIKPQNLMLTPKGEVKILDFGLAKMASERGQGKGLTASNSYMGTPDYSAPEQATDARTADIRADIYSLGCTLYALLAGHPPFQEDTPIKTILAHLETKPVPLPELRPDVPAELWAVVAKMLAKQPEKRYQTPAAVAAALAPFVKPGTKAVLVPPGVASPKRPTVAAHDTSRLSRAPGAAPAPPKRKSKVVAAPVAELCPTEPPPAPRSRLGSGCVAAGIACGLVGLAGAAVLLVAALNRGTPPPTSPSLARASSARQVPPQQADPTPPATAPARSAEPSVPPDAEPSEPPTSTPEKPSGQPKGEAPPGDHGRASEPVKEPSPGGSAEKGPDESKRPEPAKGAETPKAEDKAPPDGPKAETGTPPDVPSAKPPVVKPPAPPAPPEADPTKARLDRAWAEYNAGMAKWHREVLAVFDQRLEIARKSGKPDAVDRARTQRDEFDQTGACTRLVPSKYWAPYQALRRALEKAHRDGVAEYTKAKKDQEAATLERKLTELQGEDSYPVAERHARYRDGSKATVVLNADKTFTHVQDSHEVRGTYEPKAKVKDVVVFRCGEFVEEWQTLPSKYVILRWAPPGFYLRARPRLVGEAPKE
jgi:serine/threonine protein kinase